ncbi:MAG TPA: AI-2E family transporter [Burkholderiaceae bacterium]
MTSSPMPMDVVAAPVDETSAVALAPSADAPAVVLHTPVNLRSASLVVIATLACLVVLHWASAVFVPLVVGLMSSYALTPLVDRRVRFHVPRPLAAATLLAAIVGGVGWTAYSLSADAAAMIETLPEVAQKLRRGIESRGAQGPGGTIDRVQKAAAEIERAADAGTAKTPEPVRGVTKVQIERPRFNVNDYLWPGALGLMAAVGQATVVVLVTFFLLLSGDNFRRKMVRIAGPTLHQRKLTLQALDEIDQQIQRYLLVQVFTSTLVGVSTGLAFLWIGVEHAAVWGVLAFALSFIPYLGSVLAIGGSALMGFVQFGSFEMAALIGGVVLVINGIEGGLLTPWLTSRAGRMNPVVVFAGVLAWGWIWGLWGLFLGVPILMAIKTVCERVDDLKAVGELLGE